jgi:glycosyltransferase involved in cell wall biosynthesis
MLRADRLVRGMKLMIVGIAGPETDNIHRLVSILGLDSRVGFLEGVSDSELRWCYVNCQAVVSPSTVEGFGLPIAEALLAGCRIVCSDIPAFREVADGQCRFVSLEKNAEEMLASAIVSVLHEPKGLPRALQQFSAPVLAKQYTSLYRRLISSAISLETAAVATSIDPAVSERQAP